MPSDRPPDDVVLYFTQSDPFITFCTQRNRVTFTKTKNDLHNNTETISKTIIRPPPAARLYIFNVQFDDGLYTVACEFCKCVLASIF